jgi:hypothetical protein
MQKIETSGVIEPRLNSWKKGEGEEEDYYYYYYYYGIHG